MKTQTTLISKLARDYAVDLRTLQRWIQRYPEIQIKKGTKALTPKQVEQIISRIGEP